MNILIKNADFSEVSIGKVDTIITLEKKSIITNAYIISDGLSYIGNGSKIFAVDVSSLVGKTIEIKGFLGSLKNLGVFYTGNCPTTNITFNSNEDVDQYRESMGEETVLNYPNEQAQVVITKNVVVPNGAKSLFVYVGAAADIDELYVKYSLI